MRDAQPRLAGLRVYAWDIASLSPEGLSTLEAAIGASIDAAEGVPIVTCQRYELVTMAAACDASPDRCYSGEQALLHLARLAGGLESLVFGEVEILGQVRSAFSAAPAGLRRLIAPAIAAARSLRAEMSFTHHAGHALDLALEHAGVEAAGRAVVVGGGPMGRRVAERARALGFETTLVARRPLALPPDIHYAPFGALTEQPPADLLVTCLGRAAPRMSADQLPLVRRLAVDLGTPRNLEDGWPGRLVTLADLTTAQRDRGHDPQRREAERRLAELLTARLANGVSEAPLGSLREEVERIRQRELERSARLHPELPPEKLDTITRTLVNQIFHRPSRRLRQSGDVGLATSLVDLFKDSSEDEPV